MRNNLILCYPHKYITDLTESEGCVIVREGPDIEDSKAVYEYLQTAPEGIMVPMSEEVVLPCAAINSERGSKGLQLKDALMCVNREKLRIYLDNYLPEHNIKWASFKSQGGEGYGNEEWHELRRLNQPYVIKALASTYSQGVTKAHHKGEIFHSIENLRRTAKECINRLNLFEEIDNYPFIIEEYADGEQYEISGVFGLNKLLFFSNCLHQKWNNGKIVEYTRCEETWIHDEAVNLLCNIFEEFNLNYCAVCIEFRLVEGEAKVIEINLRLGEEKGDEYYPLLSDYDIHEKMKTLMLKDIK